MDEQELTINRQVAKACGCKEGTVRNIISQARNGKKIRTALGRRVITLFVAKETEVLEQLRQSIIIQSTNDFILQA